MTFETKEQVLEKVLAQQRPRCPSCNQEMDIWEVPPITFSDGLGWGVPFLFVCFNDECPTYKQGWQNMEDNYGHRASCRNICYPGSDRFECMPVFGTEGAKGQIVTDEALAEQERLQEATKRGFSLLADFFTTSSWFEVLKMLMDATEPARVRQKAAEMLGDIGEPDTIEPLKNITTGNAVIDRTVDGAITKIHERHYTRECPFCAEIIKKRAKVCKHCGQEVTPAS